MRLSLFQVEPTMNLRNMCWLVILAILECCWRTSSSNLPKEALAEVEASLLSLFGFKSRPKIDKSKIVIPQALIEMYEKQTGFPFETASIPKKGLHTRSANTIRSFTHIGRWWILLHYYRGLNLMYVVYIRRIGLF